MAACACSTSFLVPLPAACGRLCAAVWLLLFASLFSTGCATRRDAACEPNVPLGGRLSAPGTVVFVLSTAPEQVLANGKRRSTGFFLGEFYEPYRAVSDAGYRVVFATVDGQPPVIDPESLDPAYWEAHPAWLAEAKAFVAEDPRLHAPMRLRELAARVDAFQGIVVPGGQGVMIDLLDNQDLHAALAEFGAADRAVGLACHAPAVLSRMPEASNPFMGRRVTSVSGFEEFYIERVVMKGRATDRGIGRQLSRGGFVHKTGAPGKPHAMRDGTLATSQNPFSGDAFNVELLAALELARAGGGGACSR